MLNVLNDVFHQYEDIEWTISVTKKYDDATVQAREAAEGGADLAAGYGGDGTQHEIANGIPGTAAAMGVLPGGTGNGFATELSTPKELRPNGHCISIPKRPMSSSSRARKSRLTRILISPCGPVANTRAARRFRRKWYLERFR